MRLASGMFAHREVLVLVHKGDSCAPDFAGLGLEGFGTYADMYALVSVDADHADEVRAATLFHTSDRQIMIYLICLQIDHLLILVIVPHLPL